MVGIPLFTLVKPDTLEEIKLVDDTGAPCAVPNAQDHRDEDHRYNYTDGSIGRSPLVQRHSITLGCDFLPDSVRSRLLRWKMDRANVLFTPGFGEHTKVAWRPVVVDNAALPSGATWYDLTGQVAMDYNGSAGQLVWDHWTSDKGSMVETWGANPALVVNTPHGAGQSIQRATTNRWSPGYPMGITEGFGAVGTYSGWVKGGTASAQITFTHVPDGFGVTACPDSLRVTTTDDITISRTISASSLWDSASGDYQGYTFAGSGYITLTLWVKGRFGPSALITLFGGTAASETLALNAEYRDWTKIVLMADDSDWSASEPSVVISLWSASGEISDFELGPVSLAQTAAYHGYTRWTPYGVTTTNESVSTSSMKKPQSGSFVMSFYIPPGVVLEDGQLSWLACLAAGATAGSVRVRNVSGVMYFYFYYSASSYKRYVVDVSEGVHTLSVSWGTSYLSMAYDGEILLTDTDAAGKNFDWLADSSIYCGYSSLQPWPYIPLTFRMDEDQHRDDMADIHASLMDTVSLGTIVAARGRQYEIQQIPSTPRMADGATYWIGNLVLSQVGYDSDLEDITTKEV